MSYGFGNESFKQVGHAFTRSQHCSALVILPMAKTERFDSWRPSEHNLRERFIDSTSELLGEVSTPRTYPDSNMAKPALISFAFVM